MCTKQAVQKLSRALIRGNTVLYFAVFPMNVSSLEFDFVDFELLYCYNALPKCSHDI